MTGERRRAALLVAIMAAVAIAVAGIALLSLYEATLETQRQRLVDLVAAREALIDAVHGAIRDPQTTLELLAEAQREAPSLGQTGEFTVARREGDRMVFLVPLRYGGGAETLDVPVASSKAEPMARALAGEHGTMIGRDYRGVRVLAAFRPVDNPQWGLVAKIDLAEVRAPVVRAAGIALLSTMLLVGLGTLLFTRVTSPMLRALAESEQRFRAVFEHATVGKSLTAPDGKLLHVNQAFAHMLGYGVDEIESMDFSRLTHPDDLAESRECIRCLLTGEKTSYRMEKRYLRRDGAAVWADVSTTLLRNGGGAPVHFITSVVDITEREQARRDLLAEKHFSEAMLSSLPGVAYLFDDSLHFHRWNANFEKVTGYSAEELATITPLDLFDEVDGRRVAERIGEVFSTGESSVEANFLAKDGSRTPYMFTGRLVEIDGQSFLVGMGLDISERRRMEEELRSLNAELERRVEERAHQLKVAHERLTFIIRATPAVIATREPSGAFSPTWVSDNVVDVLGYRPEELIAGSRLWLGHVHPDDRERVQTELAGLLEDRELSHEYRVQSADGDYLWIHAEARMVRDDDGQPQEIVSTWLDITGRREQEESIRRLNRELSRSVEKLAAANKELESFSYTVSHDLRAPLRAIDGFSRILVEEHGEELEGEARRYLQIVRDNTQHMGRLIDDLLAFSRLSRQELRRSRVDLAEVVEEAWNDLAGERAGRHIELVRGALPAVSGDPRLLKIAWVNLLANAIKFTRTRDEAIIEVGQRGMDGKRVVFVQDNGVGFDMRYRDKLFGVFQRLHRAEEFEGTGVGLATVARIVHRHGGDVWAEGEVGRGATFFMTFDGGGDDGTDASS